MKKFRLLAIVLVVVLALSLLTACKQPDNGGRPEGDYTYNTYLAVSPSNWNELTYQDNNDTNIMSYISVQFFEFNFKFDEDGAIIDGEFTVDYSGATALEDITSEYVGAYEHIGADDKGLVWKITLRDDLKWDDGTAISAADYVYTMKQQLDPLFKNYRADSFYVGATVLHNAKAYVYQGDTTTISIAEAMAIYGLDSIAAVIAEHGSETAYCNWSYSFGAFWNGTEWVDAEDEVLETAYTLEEFYTVYTGEIGQSAWGGSEEALIGYFPDEVYINYTYPAVDFNDVGIFVGDTDYEIILVLDSPLYLLKDDGTLAYKAAYNMASLPLVKEDLYEACKIEPAIGSTLWTTNYNSSLETSASSGPYKLTEFQSGKSYTLERNEYWYGYNMEVFDGQYCTTKISCETIDSWETAWLKFQAGELDDIGIDVSIATDYKGSEQAYFTPSSFIGSMQLQSSRDALEAREEDGVNKTILTYQDFRKALSLGFDRSEYAKTCTTSSLPGFGIFNSMHYYDVANGKAYRNSDEAKQVLCDIYGIDVAAFPSLDDAVDSITGYDIDQARALITSAYNEALAAGDISATDTVKLVMGFSADTEAGRRRYNFINDTWQQLMVGTPLEGRFEIVFDASFGSKWATDFRAGAYDICMGGWSGAAWDPGYFLLAYLSPSYMYSKAWDTSSVMMTFTMEGLPGGDVTATMSLLDWYDCLNGNSDTYDWSSGAIDESLRLQLIAALEKQVLQVYYTLPLYNDYAAAMHSFKTEFGTYSYNTFMGFGGIRYITYNYNDTEWAEFVTEQGGQIDYK